MYGLLLPFHSWVRWLVLAALVTCFVRAILGFCAKRDWSLRDRRLLSVFIAAFDTQVLIGLILYFLASPLTPKSMADFAQQMGVASLRFFAIEHVTMMVCALVVAHLTLRAARGAPTLVARQRRLAWGLGVTLALIVGGIPWPFLAYGRPLFRG
jgi:hypothetical protein